MTYGFKPHKTGNFTTLIFFLFYYQPKIFSFRLFFLLLFVSLFYSSNRVKMALTLNCGQHCSKFFSDDQNIWDIQINHQQCRRHNHNSPNELVMSSPNSPWSFSYMLRATGWVYFCSPIVHAVCWVSHLPLSSGLCSHSAPWVPSAPSGPPAVLSLSTQGPEQSTNSSATSRAQMLIRLPSKT